MHWVVCGTIPHLCGDFSSCILQGMLYPAGLCREDHLWPQMSVCPGWLCWFPAQASFPSLLALAAVPVTEGAEHHLVVQLEVFWSLFMCWAASYTYKAAANQSVFVLCCFFPFVKVSEVCSGCSVEDNNKEEITWAELCEKVLNANRFLTVAQGYYIKYAL